jgi:hypothetical protein
MGLEFIGLSKHKLAWRKIDYQLTTFNNELIALVSN